MKELFDERLSQKIRQTFDKYEEPYNAQGWEMMKQQMHTQKPSKVRALLASFPVKAAAAAVLVLGGVFTYKSINSNFKPHSQQQAVVTKGKVQEQTNLENVQVLPPSIDGEHSTLAETDLPEKKTSATVVGSNPVVENQYTKGEKATAAYSTNDFRVTPTVIAKNNKSKVIKSEQIKQPLFARYDINALAKNETNAYIATSADNSLPALSTASFQAITRQKVAQYQETQAKRGRKINLGLVVSSLVNYSDKGEKDSQMNLGGGLLSEIPLSKKLSITSGVLLTRQSLEMNKPAGLPTFATTQDLGTNQVVANSSKEQNRSVRMQFVGLDFPINLQYHVGKNANRGLFVSIGVSSLAYLQEDYTHTTREVIQRRYYKPGALVAGQPQSVETYTSETNLKSNPQSLSRFDFAKMLNISMGMKYMVAKSMQLQIEPYIKYPLGSLTNEQLKFGSAGVNLRCSFTGVRRH